METPEYGCTVYERNVLIALYLGHFSGYVFREQLEGRGNILVNGQTYLWHAIKMVNSPGSMFLSYM